MRESGTEVLGQRQNEGKTQLTDILIVGSYNFLSAYLASSISALR